MNYANGPLSQANMPSDPCATTEQASQTPPEQLMGSNPNVPPLRAEQNTTPASPHMNPFLHAGYGQPFYPYTMYNAYNSGYVAPGFNIYGSHGMNAAMHNHGPVPAPSSLSPQDDRIAPPFAPNTLREGMLGNGTSEPQSQSITQRFIETHVITSARQGQITHATHDDGPRETRINATSTTHRYANAAPNRQRPSYFPEIDAIPAPGDTLEANRIPANNDRNDRARRRYGTSLQPGTTASASVRGSSQNGNIDTTRAAQTRTEEDWRLQQYIHHVRTHDRLFAMAQSHEFARLEAERAQRIAEASKPKGLDDQNDGRPPPKEAEELTVNLECKICMTQLVDTVVLPCGHAVMCRWCARQHMPNNKTSAKCPVCRVNIKAKTRIFIA